MRIALMDNIFRGQAFVTALKWTKITFDPLSKRESNVCYGRMFGAEESANVC